MLEQFPTKEEICHVIFDMDGGSAPGRDGYTGRFFSFVWSIIGDDVVRAVCSLFCRATLPRVYMAPSIMLIPKVAHRQDFYQFKLISLCNFLNKLFLRLLADRLARVLLKIISPQQSGFIHGHLLSDNFLLTQKLVSDMSRTAKSCNVTLKLDMPR